MGRAGGTTRRRTARIAVVTAVGLTATLALTGCGPYAPDLPTAPLRPSEMLGTWSSDDAGTITFDATTVTLDDVPLRGVTGDRDDGTTPTDTTGRWRIDGTRAGWGWKTIEVETDTGTADLDLVLRGLRGHRELELVVGDPDEVDWYRYRHVPGAPPATPTPTPRRESASGSDAGTDAAGRRADHL